MKAPRVVATIEAPATAPIERRRVAVYTNGKRRMVWQAIEAPTIEAQA